MTFKVSGSDGADVVAGYFGSLSQPADNTFADCIGSCFGLAFGRSNAEAGGYDTVMQLFAYKDFAVPASSALDNVSWHIHPKNPLAAASII